MMQAFIITLREGLEAFLIIAIRPPRAGWTRSCLDGQGKADDLGIE